MDDDRLRDAFRLTAREPTTDGVVEHVRAKRDHRRTVRRIEHGLLVAAVFLGVVAVGIVALDEQVSEQRVAVAPTPGSAPRVRVVERGRTHQAAVRHLRLDPDEGYVRGPLFTTGEGTIALAAYDRAGDTFTFPPSRIVLIDRDGAVVDRIDLEGEILSLTEGEGARWALTRDKTVIGPEDPEFRVKRLGPDGTVTSNAVPPGEQPAGRIAAGGGGVWVPVRDGVLRFDPVTGAFTTKVTLPTVSDHRAVVAAGKFFFVTDANTRVRLDPAQEGPAGVVDTLEPGIELVDATNVPGLGISFLLGFDTNEGTWIASDGNRVLAFHEDFTATSIHAAGNLVWVDGTIAGVRALAVLDNTGGQITVARTVRLTKADDAAVVLVSKRAAIVAADGSLYRVDLPT